jgi:hypothetical protein
MAETLHLRKLLTDPREAVRPNDKIIIKVFDSQGDENLVKIIKLRGLYDSKINKVLKDYGNYEVTFTEYDVLNKIVITEISPLF